MKETRYLIVGGGLAGDAACKGIREIDAAGEIVLVGAEPHPPYSRPPLSKALWKGAREDTVWRGTEALGVDVRVGRQVVELDLAAREALDDRGDRYRYEKLLLATGVRPRRLRFGGDEVIYFRTLDDFRRLRALADRKARAVVIGGGFIGSEIAAALALNGCAVTMVFPESGIGARIFPPSLSAALDDFYRARGVQVLAASSVSDISRGDVVLSDGRVLTAEVIVAGVGTEPNVELAAAAGLPVADGIVVDALARIDGRDDVYAAGDVACFPCAALGGALRVEHEHHAKNHGKLAGANMAGAGREYDYLPFFYSDLFELGYEAVGELDTRLETVIDGHELGGQMTVYYVDGEHRPRGVLLWNRFGQVHAANDLIRSAKPIARGALAPTA
jgi:NADPH-dependent 2,4-dienoyl-CoA reductase/sulfur reductase-like enzyme